MNEMDKNNMTLEQDNGGTPEEKKDLADIKSKKKIAVIAAAVAIVAAVTGVCVYNSPQNRAARLVHSGNQYLETADYDRAADAFEQAAAIDAYMLTAYVGGVEACLGKGMQDGAEAFYKKALSAIEGMDADALAKDMEQQIAVYLAADRVYADNPEKAAEVLETGFAKTGENEEIKSSLAADYQKIAGEKTADGNYEEALGVYDRLLELDDKGEMVQGLAACLKEHIDTLMKQGNYDEIRELTGRYEIVGKEVDFDGILAEIDKQEKLRAENAAFMQKIFDLMASEDYEAMRGVDGSDEARAFVEKMEGDRYIFLPDGGTTGFGAGVYTFGEGGYYFYYGDYVEGEREGNGTDFIERDEDSYYLLTGIWKDDKPNGKGKQTDVSEQYGIGFTEGTLADGLWDGKVTYTFPDEYADKDFELSYTVEKGIPTEDKTAEFLTLTGWESMEDGWYVIAYERHYYEMFGQIVYQDRYLRMRKGETIGALGFADTF